MAVAALDAAAVSAAPVAARDEMAALVVETALAVTATVAIGAAIAEHPGSAPFRRVALKIRAGGLKLWALFSF